MKKIETPLTWALGILSILLITFTSLNSTTKNYNLGNASSDNNNYWDLNYEHELKESSDFSLLKTYGAWGEESCDSNTEAFEGNSISSDTILVDIATESKMITDTILLE